MSILLDALRKSENQKRIGEAPSIHSAEVGSSVASRSGGGRLWLILVPVIMALAWFGWQQFMVTGDTSESGSQDVALTPELEEGSESPATPAGTDASSQDSRPAVPAPPTTRFTSPVASLPEDPAAGDSTPGSTPGSTTGSPSSSPSASTPGNASDSPSGGAGTSPGATTRETVSSPPEPARVTLDEPARPESRESAGRQPISFWELPETVRNEVGETRISVLVYDEEPENRFILMNGVRVSEGANLDNGLEVEEIRRDGVIFLFRNYRFIINR